MVFNATFNNISVISWRSVLLAEETGVPRKKTTNLSQVTDKLYHIMLYRVHEQVRPHDFIIDSTDCSERNHRSPTRQKREEKKYSKYVCARTRQSGD